MTETQWLEGTDSTPMLEFLRGKGTDRKLRLFACACCRTIIHFADERCRDALAMADQFAEGLATANELETARRVAHEVFNEFQGVPEDVANAVGLTCCLEDLEWKFTNVASTAQALAVVGVDRSFMKASRILARRKQSRWLRDIVGNPFRPITPDRAWLTPTVQALAQAAYINRHLPTGTHDNARLAILADALEDAGCNNTDIMNHLRQPAEHVRGCWVLDRLLSKE